MEETGKRKRKGPGVGNRLRVRYGTGQSSVIMDSRYSVCTMEISGECSDRESFRGTSTEDNHPIPGARLPGFHSLIHRTTSLQPINQGKHSLPNSTAQAGREASLVNNWVKSSKLLKCFNIHHTYACIDAAKSCALIADILNAILGTPKQATPANQSLSSHNSKRTQRYWRRFLVFLPVVWTSSSSSSCPFLRSSVKPHSSLSYQSSPSDMSRLGPA